MQRLNFALKTIPTQKLYINCFQVNASPFLLFLPLGIFSKASPQLLLRYKPQNHHHHHHHHHHKTAMCTLEKRGLVYLLTLTGPTDDHRLNPTLFADLLSSLSRVNSDISNDAKLREALVIAGEGKFFSNGFDLDWARRLSPTLSTSGPLLSSLLKDVLSFLLSLRIPTVAAVNGHASAAGLILAFAMDYVVMRSDRGFLYLSETDIGLEIPDYFVEVVKSKVGSGKSMRDMVLVSKKVTASEAVDMGAVDLAVAGEKETVEAAVRLGAELAAKGWDGVAYARNRAAMMPEVCRMVGLTTRVEAKL